jgi:hypothetical protein
VAACARYGWRDWFAGGEPHAPVRHLLLYYLLLWLVVLWTGLPVGGYSQLDLLYHTPVLLYAAAALLPAAGMRVSTNLLFGLPAWRCRLPMPLPCG